jgi:hypothetical protein
MCLDGERRGKERERGGGGENRGRTERLPESFLAQIWQFGKDGLVDEIRPRSSKRRRASHEHVADDPRRPNVASVIVIGLQHLRSCVVTRPHSLSNPLSRIEVFAQAEVDEDEVRVRGPVTEQEIF